MGGNLALLSFGLWFVVTCFGLGWFLVCVGFLFFGLWLFWVGVFLRGESQSL